MTTFVLVHGAWHDGSAWNPVITHLERKGHTAFGPTIAGHGKRVDKNVNHAQCTQSIVDYIVNNGITDFVLLGHSFGGTVIAKVAEAVPERIRRLIFCDAFVLNDGESLQDILPEQGRARVDTATRAPVKVLPFPVWREAFINDGDLELARWSYELLSPEPYLPSVEKLDMKKFYSLQIPKSYLVCTDDNSIVAHGWSWHPTMSSRLGVFRLVQMPGGHEVIFTNPVGLAEKIIEAGRE